ncbi:hypothetical protein [Halobacillus aidingensis]|uniref:DUF2834 domain-containing protein n=1 Tax=Halobacillus aidingensis TaxID=240303 RepID=A0A1H0H2Q4_HALAD|nr:hypothetical protein [Halobacillus aidingensis]SDO13418.1 hypothetical protein SAMN05421677_10331 [Halobacillus aidingensis]
MTIRKSIFFISWIAFIAYAVYFAPNGNQGYLHQLMTMDDPDPFLLMVFSFLGIYPLVFSALLLGEDDSRLPLWPFVAGMFMFGAFALMPYFFLSEGKTSRQRRTPKWLLKGIQSVLFYIFLIIGTVALFLYGVIQGNFHLYLEAFQTSQFVHVMTIDFFILTFLSSFVIYWRERKNGQVNQLHWLGFMPIVGAILYLIKKRK